MTWKNIKVKTFGGYEVRKHRNSYEGIRKDETVRVARFSVWQSAITDAAWDKEDIDTFIAESQKQSQAQIKRITKLQYEQSLANVRHQYKKKTGRDISIFQLKKNIKNYANKMIESKKAEINEMLDKLRSEEMKKELEQVYGNCSYSEDENGIYCNLANGNVLKLDSAKFNSDKILGLLPDDLSEIEKWELYSSVVKLDEQQKNKTIETEKEGINNEHNEQ